MNVPHVPQRCSRRNALLLSCRPGPEHAQKGDSSFHVPSRLCILSVTEGRPTHDECLRCRTRGSNALAKKNSCHFPTVARSWRKRENGSYCVIATTLRGPASSVSANKPARSGRTRSSRAWQLQARPAERLPEPCRTGNYRGRLSYFLA